MSPLVLVVQPPSTTSTPCLSSSCLPIFSLVSFFRCSDVVTLPRTQHVTQQCANKRDGSAAMQVVTKLDCCVILRWKQSYTVSHTHSRIIILSPTGNAKHGSSKQRYYERAPLVVSQQRMRRCPRPFGSPLIFSTSMGLLDNCRTTFTTTVRNRASGSWHAGYKWDNSVTPQRLHLRINVEKLFLEGRKLLLECREIILRM